MIGNTAVKSFNAFQVNEALLAKVCEAIIQGEVDARRYSEIKSFEIYYDGFRSRMVFGRIMIIPAKLADSPEDFPSALLYGALVREINPDQLSDLFTYKLGESEFDEYDKKDLAGIKDRLFKDVEGRYRSIILFIPTWGNVRDYVIFKYTREYELLHAMVRHQIYGAYFNPALSSAFDHLVNDTTGLNVADITPKINYPGLAFGIPSQFPNLEPGDGGAKLASSPKPRMLLAKDTVNEINEEFLEPGELAVIDSLAEDLKAAVSGEIEAPIDVAKQGSTDDAGATTGLRNQPDYGEKDSYTSESNSAAAEPKQAAYPEHECTGKGRGQIGHCAICGKELVKKSSVRPAPKQAKVVISCEGSKLAQLGNVLTATAKSGHVETIRLHGSKIKWQRPTQFTLAFRAAAQLYARNPSNGASKTADVPQTFEDIWSEIADDMGPVPQVDLKAAPASEKKSDPPAAETPAPRSDPPDAPEAPAVPKTEEKPTEKVDAPADKQEISKSDAGFQEFIKKEKEAAFDMFIPGQVLKEFYPEVLHDTVEYPNDGFDQQTQSPDGKPESGTPYVATDPTAAMGLGNDGKPHILDGAPLKQENDIRGYQFDQEFYAQSAGGPKLSSQVIKIIPQRRRASALRTLSSFNKKAGSEEFAAQFSDFLKKAMGEIAATFIASFKVTSRPPMNRVPGTGEIKLDDVERNATFGGGTLMNVSSRVAYLMTKLTDSQIKDAINGAYSQASVWNEDPNGGFNYEVFVRPDTLDKTTLILKYNFVIGTKGL